MNLSQRRPEHRDGRDSVFFLCVALTSAIIAGVMLGNRGGSTFVEAETKASLYLGLAAFGFSSVVAGRWLTLKMTWIAAIAL
jgi:hypothetical protein